MKLNKNKGKVHPSPSSSASPSSSSSSSSSASSSSNSDPISTLNLVLPATILTLISVLSLQDREVLAYMITRSLKSSNPSSSLIFNQSNKKKKQQKHKKLPSSMASHESPTFDCECFDCYTTYWFRWDSSPNRELIHQAIEAFEEHLSTTEQVNNNSKGRRREKISARRSNNHKNVISVEVRPVADAELNVDKSRVEDSTQSSPEIRVSSSPEDVSCEESTEAPAVVVGEEVLAVGGGGNHQQQNKGLARKVLPDVIGLLNSRLWNLWCPNV